MVNSRTTRRRLSVEDRHAELLSACLHLIGAQSWDEVSMADVAAVAGVSKPLLYHYFSTKRDLYVATVRAAADQLREATRPDPALPAPERLLGALGAHVDWIDDHAGAYLAILQGGMSSDPDVKAVVESSRVEVIDRLTEGFRIHPLTPARRITLRGWIGFLEGACVEWLVDRPIPKRELVRLLAESLTGAVRVGPAR